MTDDRVRDLVGVGFGPSGIALAVALEEHHRDHPTEGPLDAVFVEARRSFAWHPGMMLPGTTMQIAFPKDLVTFRNPRSRYTFFNYLYESGRLVDLVNRKTFFPTRVEFADYLGWAARTVDAEVLWGTRVMSVDPGTVGIAAVHLSDGTSIRARSVVLSPGLRPRLPDGVEADERIFHNVDVLDSLAALPSTPLGKLAVLGAGQSAAEVTAHLHDTHPTAEVHLVHARFGISPSDDTPFANRVFDPATVDLWYGAPPEVRARMLGYHRNTNYSAADEANIVDLYEREYAEKVSGNRRLFVHNATEVTSVTREGDAVVILTRDLMTGLTDELRVDALVCATGFRHPAAELVTDTADPAGPGPDVTRDHRLRTGGPGAAPIFLNGGAEYTHGLGSTLLSGTAIRAGEILDSLLRHHAAAAA